MIVLLSSIPCFLKKKLFKLLKKVREELLVFGIQLREDIVYRMLREGKKIVQPHVRQINSWLVRAVYLFLLTKLVWHVFSGSGTLLFMESAFMVIWLRQK